MGHRHPANELAEPGSRGLDPAIDTVTASAGDGGEHVDARVTPGFGTDGPSQA